MALKSSVSYRILYCSVDENVLEDNEISFISLVGQFQRQLTLHNLNVDFQGTFVESSDPNSIFAHQNYLNATRSASMFYWYNYVTQQRICQTLISWLVSLYFLKHLSVDSKGTDSSRPKSPAPESSLDLRKKNRSKQTKLRR